MKDQRRIPIMEMLQEYQKENVVPFHMPGHKGGKGFLHMGDYPYFRWDITEFQGSDNLHHPQGAIKEAQDLAAEAFGASHTFFLVNGSSVGITAMLLAVGKPGDKIIIPRNCHKSVMSGIILGDLRPVYLMPEIHEEQAVLTGVSPKAVEDALQNHPDAVGVLVTYPNYYGMGSDVKEIAKIVHEKGKQLLVDEAHGAHFPFSRQLPPSSGELGADMWVQSAHKTLPSLTQTAYLHTNSGAVDPSRLQYILQLLHTTSPSYLLMASLDWARYYMVRFGERAISHLINYTSRFRERINGKGKLYCFGDEWIGEPGVRHFDATRLVIDVRQTGYSGYEIDEILRKKYSIQIEMGDWYHVVCIASVSDDGDSIDTLESALTDIALSAPPKTLTFFNVPLPVIQTETKLSPREAAYSIIETTALENSEGRISADTIGVYPPGIPLFCPGEVITAEGIAYLKETIRMGGTIFGWHNPAAQTIRIIKEH